MEDFLQSGGHRAYDEPGRGRNRDQRETLAFHLEQHDRADRKRDGREHLVGGAKQGPQRPDSAQWVDHADIEKVSPQRHRERGSDQIVGPGGGFLESRHRITDQILNHETEHPCSGIDRGQDEQRFEQDREVIPNPHQRRSAEERREDARHADRERRCAAGARHDRRFADILSHLGDLVGGHHKSP